MLPPERLKPFLTHEDKHVRDAVARHFGESYSRDPELLGLVMDACERYGDENNLGSLRYADQLVVPESSFVRVLQHLAQATDETVIGYFNSVLLDAPVELVIA